MTEKTATRVASTMVAIIRNFCALLLLRKASPPPPKTGDKPVPGACNKIAVINNIETIICIIVKTIRLIIYVLPLEMQVFQDHGKVESLH